MMSLLEFIIDSNHADLSPKASKYIFVQILICILFSCEVFAWGSEGHQIVANIAQNMLSKEASQITNIMTQGKSLAYLAPLPDDYDHSSQGTWSKPCHYVNFPKGASGFAWSDCPGYCVVQSINNNTDILKETQADPQPCNFDQSHGVEPCALEYLVHYVGDVHQPLHAGYSSDSGGNSVTVYFFGSKTNLHTVWDTKIIQKWNSDVNKASSELLDMISNDPTLIKTYSKSTDPVEWANESYQIVEDNCYNYTVSGDENIIDEEYYETNLPVIQQRLIAGGIRLANLLNSVLVGPVEPNLVIQAIFTL